MMFGNQTQITEFILLGFGDVYKINILLFLVFLFIYIVTMSANVLIVVLVVFDQHLHSPMYLFLGTLSFVEACFSSSFLPKVLSDLWTGDRIISVGSCMTQWYFCASFLGIESCLLCAMSYDRYLAICKPLHYPTMMKTETFIHLATASWINGCSYFFILLTVMLKQLNFCGPNEIDHFFCDFSPLLKLSCSDTSMLELMMNVVAGIYTVFLFLLTLTSYAYIAAAILKIPSTTGRKKAFSTCSSHLVVVSIFYGTIMTVYVLPASVLMGGKQKFSSLLYTTLPCLINPFIYSLRNKEFKNILRNNINRLLLSKFRVTNLRVIINI